MFQRTKISTAALLALGGTLMLSSACVSAQETAAPQEPQPQQEQPQPQPLQQRVEVTGSRIKRIDTETSSPVQMLSREEIKNTGANSIKELVDHLSSASGTLSDISGSNSFSGGASSANLRNMGKASTLVLLNGRRVSPYALADFNEVFTNLDSLPMEAVERVEVLKNGASAIYGSDAVAGVVNIITRRDYQGVQVSAAHEQSSNNGRFRETTAAVTGGFGNLQQNGYNIFGNIELFQRESVMWRDVMGNVNPERFRPGAIPTTFATQASTYSWPGNIVGAGGGPLPGCAPELLISNLCRHDRFSRFEAVPAADRVNMLINGRMKLGENAEAFGEVLYSNTKTTYQNPYPIYQNNNIVVWGNPQTNSSQTFYYRGLGASHPLNPLKADDVDFRYRFIDTPSNKQSDSDAYRILAGLRGAWHDLDWETSLGFLGAKTKQISRGAFSNSGFIEMIGDYNQNPLPADFFNKPNGYKIGQANSAAVIDRLFPAFGTTGQITQTVWDGKLSGEWGQLEGGPIGFAAGLDLRNEKMTITPTANMAQGDIVGYGISTTDGSRSFGAIFGELNLPFTKSLETQIAARVDKFPGFDAHFSPMVGVKWRANDVLMLRGTVETGFRAPNLTETAPSTKFSFDNGNIDPKRCTAATNLANELRDQAKVLPDSNAQKSVLLARADTVEQNECSAGVAIITKNNPELKPEVSTSYTLGLLLQPTKDLDFSLDYWNIARKDEINLKSARELLAVEDTGLPAGTKISRLPLNAASDPTFSAAEIAKYGVAAGPLLAIESSFQNISKTKTSGIDIGAHWAGLVSGGRLDLGLQAQYLMGYHSFVGSDNRFGNNLAGRYGYPRLNAVLAAALTTGPWVNGLRAVYTSGTSLEGDYNDPTGTLQWCVDKKVPTCRINDFTTLDYSLRYKGIKNLVLGLHIRNILNTYEPVDWRSQYNTPIPQARSDVNNRRAVRVSLEYKF